MPQHISVRDVCLHASTTGVRIYAVTDIPCHLCVRLSRRKPWIHKKPSLRRGVAFAEDVRFCFTVFEDNEQNEWGDTLEHTWWKTDWPVCTTKYFYIWGYAGGIVAVSTTAIFSWHNDGVDPWEGWGLIFMEQWSLLFPYPLELQLIFFETWTFFYVDLELKFFEPWSFIYFDLELKFLEEWSS